GETEDGGLFIVMEYVRGQTLKALIQAGPIGIGRAVALGTQVAEALERGHPEGVIHRDIKPANIMVRTGTDEIKLMDFGIARPSEPGTGPRHTRTGMIVGTPEYIAPEQIEGGVITAQTDLYAWGIVMYELLTGEVPFHAPTPAAMLIKHLQ